MSIDVGSGGRGHLRPESAGLDKSDADLAKGLRNGDTKALDLVYRRYGSVAYALARRVVGDDALAEDVVQESFIALWRNPPVTNLKRADWAVFSLESFITRQWIASGGKSPCTGRRRGLSPRLRQLQ